MNERWAFSESELIDSTKCKSHDELIALLPEVEESVIVYRNGEVSNRYIDGTRGVRGKHAAMASDTETLLHPNGEETAIWKDVIADANGNFVR